MRDEILVTGATGFVGGYLVPALIQQGCVVRSLSRRDGDIARDPLHFPNVAHVFHLAAKTFVPDSWSDPRPFYEINVLGSLNILEFCRSSKASITLVSSYVYGRPQQLPIPETHRLQAFNPYAQTKLMSEEIGRLYAQYYDVALTIVRPFNLYGPGQDSRFLIPSLIEQVLDPACAELRVADPEPRRDYLFITDFIDLLLRTRWETARGKTYNAGSGVSVSVRELAAAVNRVTGKNKPVVSSGELRLDEVLDVVADVSRAAADLDWRPRTSLDEGIAVMASAKGQ